MGKLASFWNDLQKNWDVYIVIIGSIAVGVVGIVLSIRGQSNITAVLSSTLAILGLVAISIRRDRQKDSRTMQSLAELSTALSSFTRNSAFEQQHDAYRHLVSMIEQDGAKEAVLFQYSCKSSLDLIRTLLRKGAKVTVYMQHEDVPANLGSRLQADRVIDSTRGWQGDLGNTLIKTGKLKVYKYRTPCTVSAIKIDNRVLCMGWYLYEKVDYAHKSYPDDIVEISGHDVAALIVLKGTNEFKALDKTFSTLEMNFRRNSEEVPL
jgi:hypothetical protein